MNSSQAGKSTPLPAVQITPAMVKRLARKYHIGLTEEDATRWLARHKSVIEKNALWATQKKIEEVLLDVTLIDWPNPRFDRMHHLICNAIAHAIAKYEASEHLENVLESWDYQEVAKLVHRFLRYREKKPITEFLVVEVGFSQLGGEFDGNKPAIPYVFELVYDKPKVVAKLAHRL